MKAWPMQENPRDRRVEACDMKDLSGAGPKPSHMELGAGKLREAHGTYAPHVGETGTVA